jgi:hypothetical protein
MANNPQLPKNVNLQQNSKNDSFRQIMALINILELEKRNPNDQEFGTKVRRIISQYKEDTK